MKFIIFISILTGSVFSQFADGNSAASENLEMMYPDRYILNLEITSVKESVSYLSADFNADGNEEILSGEQIIPLGKNTYLVKNASLTTFGGDVFEFSSKLKKNNSPVINQVNGTNGYIIVFSENSSNAEVYIAGEYRNIDSDPILISIK
ncbi:MAG TPA: hypothetical protein PKE39_12990 [Ignavibacteria bacterium]|nr:hypothetical protein [Ignavibacteria bacterium]HMQ99935.1 hypothetical protein [Ignavibacteria bacterium]